jgi:hypothetical protein
MHRSAFGNRGKRQTELAEEEEEEEEEDTL